MRRVTVVVMVAAFLTSACGVALERNQDVIGSQVTSSQLCDGRTDGQSGTNLAECGPTRVHIRFDQQESPGTGD
jgi:hypothetical protein